ncbi:MAG TPA: geranylgeranyl reductase family protein [Nitrospiraceae bacterium]|nr:geranylgeranyl reductase family protein [Nitrospiraceae bacterium]
MQTHPEAKVCDVLVVGLGPAGATVAYELSRAGISVIALEKESHPRYKVCGGGLSARVDHILGSDFHSVVEQTIHGVQFTYQGKEPLTIDADGPIAYMVMRDRFDHVLVEQARHAGTSIYEHEPVVDCISMADGVEVRTERNRYRAKVVIGADGANSRVAQRIFTGRRVRRSPALESEVQTNRVSSYPGERRIVVDVGATNRGYAWVFPKRDRLSIGIGDFHGRPSSLKQLFHRFIVRDQALSALDIPPACGHPLPLYDAPYALSTHSLVRGHALLVGDAAHLVDPLFGEGIYYAIRSGQMAADAVLGTFSNQNRSLLDYETAVRQEIYPEFHVAARLAQIIYTFPRLCHRLTSRYQDVIHLYYDVFKGRETYQTFYAKAKGLVKASTKDLLRKAVMFG